MDRSAIAVDRKYRLEDEEVVVGLRDRVTVDVVDIDIVFVAAAAVATGELLNHALCLQRPSSPVRTLLALPVQPMSRMAQLCEAIPKGSVWFFASARMVALDAA